MLEDSHQRWLRKTRGWSEKTVKKISYLEKVREKRIEKEVRDGKVMKRCSREALFEKT